MAAASASSAAANVSLLFRRSSPPSLNPASSSSAAIALRSYSFVAPFSLSLSSSASPLRSRLSPSSSSSSSSPSLVVTAASALADSKKRVLIVNTNSGGHAVIGFYFAQQLLSSGHAVTVLTVGDESSDKMKKPPFSRFSELVTAGGRTVWGDPAEVGKVVGGAEFDVVLENNGKDLDTVNELYSQFVNLTVPMALNSAEWRNRIHADGGDFRKPVADWAKSAGVKQFLYISSAGIYKPGDEVPHVEGDPVKGDASHVFAEKYIADLSFSSWAIFRPQYMIGSGNNKDCEEWFFDRIVRDRPVPIPGSGMQLTNISHVRDLSSMLFSAVGNPAAASGNIFNCVSDRAVTLDGMARLCARAAGKEVKVVHYDPKAVGIDVKKAFPFRNMHFYAEPRAAKEILGWTSSTNLAEDLKERFEEYVSIGRDKKQMQFDIDDKILESLRVPVGV